MRSGSYDPLTGFTDRHSSILNREEKYQSNRKEGQRSFHQKTQFLLNENSLKASSGFKLGSVHDPLQIKVNNPRTNLNSPHVQIFNDNFGTSSKKNDSIIRADLFGTYGEKTYEGYYSEYGNSNTFIKNNTEETFVKNNSNQKGNEKNAQNRHESALNGGGEAGYSYSQNKSKEKSRNQGQKASSMSWTGQYSQFLQQLDKLKKEIEMVGDENLELANLISG